MDDELERDRLNREKTIQRLLSQRDPNRVKEGIDAYKRDLPQMLRDHKDHFVVAYDGSRQVAIAQTREGLLQELIDKGIPKTNDMFIKVVKSLEDSDNVEHFHSSHSR